MEVLMYSCKGTVTFVVLVTFTSSTEGRSNGTGVDLHGLSLPMKGTTARKACVFDMSNHESSQQKEKEMWIWANKNRQRCKHSTNHGSGNEFCGSCPLAPFGKTLGHL